MNTSRKIVPPAFYRALNRFRGSLSDEEKKIFHHLTSEKEVWSLVEELQNEQGSRGALRNMNRIEPFINGMAQYASVIEVFLQAKPEIMALVWGPLKLLLQLASGFIESFDRVLDAIERIGENLPRFRRFSAIFSYSDQIQHVISLIYEDIMDFYRRALKFFRRRAWRIVFNLTWDSFENRFGLILNNLQRHQSLVDNEARAEEIEQAHTARQEALKQFEAFQERDRNERMMAIFDWLNPANVEADKDKVITKKSPGTGNWLHEAKEIKEWIQGRRKFIWLTGIPGSGKTILSFSILEHLEMEGKSTDSSRPILYFFCGYGQAHRNTSLAILRTFIYQIVNQDKDLLPYVYREWMDDHHSHSSVSKLKKLFCNLLEASVTASEHAYIIVDGLDELPDNERREFLPVLKALRSKAPFNSIARIFVASRNLSDIRTGFSTLKATEISIEGNNTDDIHKYIECETQRVGEQFGLETEMRELIADSLRTRADGMFLWVHLIIESLLTQTTIKGIRETLGDLPKGLDQAYERILLRIKSLPLHAQGQANKILDWLTCGFRTLKVSELEDAFAISPGDHTVDGDNRPFRDSFRFLCGPIIELTDQDTVVFVHFSAKEYLLNRYSGPFINRGAAHLNISLICTTYQCFRCFEPALPSDMAAKSVLNGDLRLFAYVQSSWLEHVREFCKLCPHDREQIERLSIALRDLFRGRNASLASNFLSPESSGPNSHQTFSPETLSKIQDFNCLESDLKVEFMRILEYRKNLERKLSASGASDELMSWSKENNPLTVDQGGRALHQVLEDLLQGNSQLLTPINLGKLRKLYGTNLYKCQYQFCQMSSSEGFATLGQRQSHEEKHIRSYRCQEQGCIYHDRGFKSKSHLRKHMKDYHTVMSINRQSAEAVEALRKALIDGEEEDERQSIFSLLDSKSVGEGSGTALDNENPVANEIGLESFELTNQLSEKTELLDRILASRAPPPLPDSDESASLMMMEIQETIDSYVDSFLDPGLVTDLRGIENSQIEILLRQLSSQLKSWKKLVQSFYIVSQNSRATEQLIFNVLHCREQYSDDFETPKGRYTTTVSLLKKTRERLGQCYFYIQNAARGDGDKEASFFDDISIKRIQAHQQPRPVTWSWEPLEQFESTQQIQDNMLLEGLLEILKEKSNSHEGLKLVELQQLEREDIHRQLSDANTRKIICQTDQFLPILILLRLHLSTERAEKLIIARNSLASQYQENGEPGEFLQFSSKDISHFKDNIVECFDFVHQQMSQLHEQDEKRAREIELRAQQFAIPPDSRGPLGPRPPLPEELEGHHRWHEEERRIKSWPQQIPVPQSKQMTWDDLLALGSTAKEEFSRLYQGVLNRLHTRRNWPQWDSDGVNWHRELTGTERPARANTILQMAMTSELRGGVDFGTVLEVAGIKENKAFDEAKDKEEYQKLLYREEPSLRELAEQEQEKRRTAMAVCGQLRVAERNRLQKFPDQAALDKVDQDWVQIVIDGLEESWNHQIWNRQIWQKEPTIMDRVGSILEIASLLQSENGSSIRNDLSTIIEKAQLIENSAFLDSRDKEGYQKYWARLVRDREMQLMLLEQQSKRRLAIARAEQDRRQKQELPVSQPQPPQPASQLPGFSQDIQRQFQTVLYNLKQKWNPQGWQLELAPTERAVYISQIASSLRLARTDIDQNVTIQVATAFERNTYDKSKDKGEYRIMCRAKLLQIRESEKGKMAVEELRRRRSQPLVSPQPVIEPPPVLGQDQDMSVSPDEIAVRNLQYPTEPSIPSPQLSKQDASQDTLQGDLTSNLRLPKESGIDLNRLTPVELAAFYRQDPSAQRESMQRYLSAQDLLQSNGIDPDRLTPEQFTSFQIKERPSQYQYIQDYISSRHQATSMDSEISLGNSTTIASNARQLLLANGIDLDRLTPRQFEAFQSQDPASQQRSINLYLAAYASRKKDDSQDVGSGIPQSAPKTQHNVSALDLTPTTRARQLLMENGIDLDQLGPELFEYFQSQGSTAQKELIEISTQNARADADDVFMSGPGPTYQAHHLLQIYGIDPNRLTPQQFETLKGQNPATQHMSIQLYAQSLFGRASKTASTSQSPGGEVSSDVHNNQQNQSALNSPVMTQTSEGAPLDIDYYYDQPSDEVPDSLVKYLDEVKKYFAQIPGKYSQFLEILSVYKLRGTRENEVYGRIGVDFGVTPEFLKGFKIAWSKYGAESWRRALEKAFLDQSTQLAMKEEGELLTPAEPKSSFGISEAERDFWYSTPPPPLLAQSTSHSTGSYDLNQYPNHPGPQNEQLSSPDDLYQLEGHSIPPPMSGPSETMSDADGPEDDPFYGIMDGIFGS